MSKQQIDLKQLLDQLKRSKELVQIGLKVDKSSNQINYEVNTKGFSCLHIPYDKLEYGTCLFENTVFKLVEYLKYNNIIIKNKYPKLIQLRNQIAHCDDINESSIKYDFEYIENIINEYINKPLTHDEIKRIKEEQINFGEKLGIYSPNDNETTKLKKSAEIIKRINDICKK